MSKVRVYELARELKMESKALVSRLKGMGVDVASHQSTLTADQILKVKKDIAGEQSSATKSPRVIRRRAGKQPAPEETMQAEPQEAKTVVRKRAEQPQTETVEAEQQQSELANDNFAAEQKDVSEASASDQTEEPAVAAVSSSSDSALVEESTASKAQEIEEEAVVESAQTLNSSVSPTEEQQPTQAEQNVAAEDSALASKELGDAKAQVEVKEVAEKPERAKESSTSGGATIVRRASPEEVKARRAAVANRERDQGGRARRDFRPSGERDRPSGDVSSRIRAEDTPSAPLGAIPPEDGVSSKWRDKARGKGAVKPGSFEEDQIKKNAIAKSRRDQLSMRTLLDQIEDVEGEEAVPVPIAGVKKRTVYTPQSSNRRRDMKRRKDLKKTQITTPRAAYRVVKMGHEITVGDLAKQLSVKASEIIKKLMAQGIMVTVNQSIDFDTVSIIASEYKYEVKSNIVSLDDILSEKRKLYDQADQTERPPIVTIMGHVDHGKTSILDAIRKAKVADGEAGGITQHIGAYLVEKGDKSVAFLDTPGHEAFSAMRARGAKVTDLVILVVAADDGVMPQTIEAISHARAAEVPIIVAVNKMDKPNINLDRVYGELMEQGIQSEEWGGETQFVKVSALQGTGLDDLLDAILLQAEMLELKAAVDAPAMGSVVEAHLDKGRGPVATIMVQQGSLKVGDFVVAGTKIGRVRAMNDHLGRNVKVAPPSTPVEVLGLSDVPMAGDVVDVVEDEKTAREVSNWRVENEQKSSEGKSSAASLEELLNKVKEAETPELPVIVKADTQGSLEAVCEAVLKLNSEKVRNRIVHKAVGGVNESDLSLAETTGSVVIAFNVRAARGLDDEAEKKGILVKYFGVIYDIVDALKAVMAGKLPPIEKEVVLGHAEVRQTIRVPKVGTVAGTAVTDGKVTRSAQVRLIRDDVVIFNGKVASLRRFKDDVKEVAQGYECGIGIEGYNDIREGDVIETYVIEEHAPAL